jgi:hypothetical protein
MPNYVYVGTYDAAGRSVYTNYDYNGPPDNQAAFTNIDRRIISEVFTKLPEGVNNYDTKTIWLKDGDIKITQPTTMKVSFLFDGAGGFLNTLGYYFYDSTTTTITNADSITTIYIIFPNCSQTGGGGIYNAGDSMLLGSAFSTTIVNGLTIGTPTNLVFPANYKIGFCLIQNAWNGTSVNTSNTKFYTIAALNPDTSIHRFNFQSENNKNYIITSFEDIAYTASSDKDVNDIIFLVIPGNFNNIDSSTVNLVASTGGDPYIRTLGGKYINVSSNNIDVLELLELSNSDTCIKITGHCGKLSAENILTKNKYNRNGEGFIRQINPKREKYYLDAIYITRLIVYFKHYDRINTLEINTLDLEILEGDLKYNILKPSVGLYSHKYGKHYGITEYTKEIVIPLNAYKLHIKTDTFWDETNEISFYGNSLKEFTTQKGLWIDVD